MEIGLQQVCKSFGRGRDHKVVVDQVSLQARGGEIFGVVGPNGAGKTTMIRMMLDILRPDQGRILVAGDPVGNRQRAFKSRVGYLPEERGLYKKRKVLAVLLYFAALRGLHGIQARRRAGELLEQFELSAWANKKIEDLSKGMSQKVQIAACVLHDPDLVVLDEPFSGLDPVNVRLVREMIMALKQRGALVFLSTHMMAEVEALCDRIFMIHEGRQVLYGSLHDIKKSYTDYEVLLDAQARPEGLDCVARITPAPNGKYVHLRQGSTIHDLMAEMARDKRPLQSLQEASTPLEDIFVAVVKGQKQQGA